MLSRAAARRHPATADNDAGATLTELIVAMTLSVILGAVTLTMFVTVNGSAASSTDRTIGSSQARDALQSWSGYLAVSDGPVSGSTSHRFEWISAHDMLFYADLNNRAGSAARSAPSIIWLRLDGNQQLVEEQFASYSTFPASYSSCRILATGVTSTTFTPYTTATVSGSFGIPTFTAGNGCQPLPVSVTQTDGIAVSNLQQVNSIQIDLSVQSGSDLRVLAYSTLASVPPLSGS